MLRFAVASIGAKYSAPQSRIGNTVLRTRKGQLTPMERAFTGKMTVSGDPAYSAEKAGYAFPAVAGNKLMHNADVAEELRRRARHRLQTEGAETSVRVLLEVANDLQQKGATRVMAAKVLGQMSGVASAASLSEADLAELPADKIRALLGEAQRALEARMARLKTIDHEPAQPAEVDCAQPAPNPFD